LAAGQSAIEAKGVTKAFQSSGSDPVKALDNVSVSIRENEFFTLLGPSGCGKTTLLRIIAGLEAPDEGDVTRKRDLRLVYLPQTDELDPGRTIEQTLVAALEGRVEELQRMRETAQRLGFERLGQPVGELSGGWCKRLAIARALITDPTLIVADEPTGDLDRATAEEILGLLERLNGEMGKTIVMVTHDPKAAGHARRIVQLEKGVLVD